MKPRKNYRSRPKKHGAKRTQRITEQKRRLIDAGFTEAALKKLNIVEIRALLKTTAKKTAKVARQEKRKAAPAAAPKKTAAKKTSTPKKETAPKEAEAPKEKKKTKKEE